MVVIAWNNIFKFYVSKYKRVVNEFTRLVALSLVKTMTQQYTGLPFTLVGKIRKNLTVAGLLASL